jgi:hypothetical protein
MYSSITENAVKLTDGSIIVSKNHVQFLQLKKDPMFKTGLFHGKSPLFPVNSEYYKGTEQMPNLLTDF